MSSVAILRPNKRLIDPTFLYLCFRNPSFIDYLKSNFISGAAIPRVVLRDFKKAKILLPPLDEQLIISSLLGALDDKIELNRQTNEILEALARAFFRDWFVDFGPVRAKAEGRPPYLAPDLWALFPDALDDDDKPVGWDRWPM
ncbi:MAG: restriction endonuclease subunit S [Rhodospirillales bacterium]|nr:restriction endonuclease subunit S [Rhodospirillales bacterium]